MTLQIHFCKMSGAGNDFVVIDNMENALRTDNARLAVSLCDRHFGIGGDGLLLMEPSVKADFFMRYYNADGSYGGMCGNGGRCVARYAALHGIADNTMSFEALGFIYRAVVTGPAVRLSMKDPAGIKSGIPLSLGAGTLSAHFIDTGSPHLVVFEEELASRDVIAAGRALRFNPRFGPDGTNVNFVRVMSPDTIEIRTYERGVETETLACGTGSVASAIIAWLHRDVAPPIHVRVKSGEELIVHFRGSGSSVSDVMLEGSAHLLFDGSLLYDETSGVIEPSANNSVLPSPPSRH